MIPRLRSAPLGIDSPVRKRRRTGESLFNECPCSGATLDKLLQPALLTALSQRPLHGYRLVRQIAGMPLFEGRLPDVSGAYRSLRSMEKRKLVEASWDVSERGPAKRLYTITPAGMKCLSRWRATLEIYREAIGELLAVARRACAGAARRPGTRKSRS
jgi:DNA-binding PadR family transcriptional regulator